LAQGCANRNQSCKALILKKNENDAFRFSCALKTQERFLEAPTNHRQRNSSAIALAPGYSPVGQILCVLNKACACERIAPA
jgi:hypothetical protein